MLTTKKYVTVAYDEHDLGKRNRELGLLLEVSNLLAFSQNLNDVLHNGLSVVLKHLGLDAGRLYLMEEDGESLRLAASLGVNTTGLNKVSINEGFTGKAARTRQFIAQHVSELSDKSRIKLLGKKGFVIIICVPLIALDRVVGVLNVAARKVISLTPQSVDLLIVMGNQIAVAVNNAQLNEELKEKAQLLEEQKSAIQFFAYTASHDLKSPAVGIHALTRRLQKQFGSSLGDKGHQYCDQILKAASHIETLVHEINAYIAAKEETPKMEDVALGELIAQTQAPMAEQMQQRGIRWILPADLPVVRGERLALCRAFQNLLENALKYGGPRLSAIEATFSEDDTHYILGVKDDGAGVQTESPERLFEAFQRGDSSRGLEGTGLGLAIVREVAKRHGGRAWLESRPGQGATFYLSLAKT